ncbi:WbqC family protein [Marivirga sp. S37H4]|uniref:WbqC family protein n=1 Tax=Marivirga aurantiaca TaxID=2802615 RepID=A0A935CAF9_9BACT|nr:WbqC family protein [Marivirga aurantiaca]MBK6266741.1 WbqC family protein [Marivirga aurantiaca]
MSDKSTPKKVLIELQYLPPIAYFTLLDGKEEIILEAHENFEKQTYRNRCEILSSQQVETLTIPLKGANKKIRTKDIRIDSDQTWQIKHWRSLKTCYGKTPFFEFFADEFEPHYHKKYEFLWDLNWDLLTKCLKIIQLPIKVTETDSFEKEINNNVIDARSLINHKSKESIKGFFVPREYFQNFGNNFEKNLSVIDLLMNEGPNARNVIQESKAVKI